MANFDGSGPDRSNGKSANYDSKFSKEKTVLIACALEGFGKLEPDLLIDDIESKCGIGSVIACVPKTGYGYEIVFRERQMMEPVLGDLTVDGKRCKVSELQSSFRLVSILNLSMYVTDEEIVDRFNKIGVEIVSVIKKHKMKSKNNIYDGTRIFKAKLPPNMKSIPYSMKFSVNEKETAYYRVIHNHQVKVCNGCFSPDHMYKDCPEFKCFECGEQGHVRKKCFKNKCSKCLHKKVSCKCSTLKKTHVDNSFAEFQGTFTRDDDVWPCSRIMDDDHTNGESNITVNAHLDDVNDVSDSGKNDVANHYTVERGGQSSACSDNGVASHITEDDENIDLDVISSVVASHCSDEGDGNGDVNGAVLVNDDEAEMVDGDDEVSGEVGQDDSMVYGDQERNKTDKEESNVDIELNVNNVDYVKSKSKCVMPKENVSENDCKIGSILNIEASVSPLEQINSQGEVSQSSCDTLDDFEMDTFLMTDSSQGASENDFTLVAKKKNALGVKRRSKINIKPNLKAARLSNIHKKLK